MENELYLPNDDCADGESCPGEGVFVPQQLGNVALDAVFVGSDADVDADLGLAAVDSYPLTDEVFPVIHEAALLTLDGLMDCFARKYPERAQLLNLLIETQGYRVTFVEDPSAAEAELEAWLALYNRRIRSARFNAVTNEEYAELRAMEQYYGEESRRLSSMRHWYFAPGRIYLSTRINRNIDVNNFLLGDDEDEISRAVTNAEGADWLNAVMGDWMVRSGIPGASLSEEFSDSKSSRIVWGTLSIIFGAAEIVGGFVVAAGTLGWGTVAGGAMTIAGYEAITQGIDMWRTPVESEHATGWLGDATFALMNEFGVLDQNDQNAFNRYWAFAMLGLSLGGAGVIGYAGDALQAQRALNLGQNLDFLATAPSRAIGSARMAIVGVKNVRFGRLIVNYAPLPSGRIVMNIRGIGRMVAPHWESLTRLRLRMNTSEFATVQYRAAKLADGVAGLTSLNRGVNNAADARRLVEEAFEAAGHSGSRFDDFISRVEFAPNAANSSFNVGSRVLTIRGNVGTGTYVTGPYNEFKALNEAIHEVQHAVARQRYVQRNGSLDGIESEIGIGRLDPRTKAEEVRVELAARERMLSLAEPRIAREELYGNSELGNRLQALLDDAVADSEEYVRQWGGG